MVASELIISLPALSSNIRTRYRNYLNMFIVKKRPSSRRSSKRTACKKDVSANESFTRALYVTIDLTIVRCYLIGWLGFISTSYVN